MKKMTAEEQIKALQEQVRRLQEKLETETESRDAAIKSKDAEIETLGGQITTLNQKVHSLEDQLYWLRKKMFGKMSEKNLPLDPNTLEPSLFDDVMTEEEKAKLQEEVRKDENLREKMIQVKSFQRSVRKPVNLENLEEKEEHLYPEGINTEEYDELEPEVTRSLVIVPSRMYVRCIVRHKFVLKSHLQIERPERSPFQIAPLPVQPIHKCMASASVLTDIVISKYFYHLPFYRVIQKYRELGVSISPSTINDWFNATCERLKPIYDRLRSVIMKKDYIQVDESTLPVIDNEKHRAVKGYIWCVRDVMGGSMFFHYDMGSRSQITARNLLYDYKGTIQTDGYHAYDQFARNPEITSLGCWAHARRKWVDALDEDKTRASEAMVYINRLYHIENEMKERHLDYEAIKARRQEESYPVILEFEKWMLDIYHQVLPSSRIMKAVKYTYPLLPRLSRYVNDGRYQIDDNLVENAIRPLALGRKNFLFCGNHDAAIRASIVYSLIGTCKALGVDARKWMEDVLQRLPEYEQQQKDIADLLPGTWTDNQ